jgi:C1A family cysteine protease
MTHRYNRHEPPKLPLSKMLTKVATVPPVADLRKYCGPVKNQGNEGSCTGHAFSESFEWIYRAYAGYWLPKGIPPNPLFSPQYFYERELIMDGDFPNDNGSDGETACNVATQYGCCRLVLDPYIDGQIIEPTAAQDADARQFMMGAYHGLTGSKVALSVLGDPVPWPVQMGFTVYASFESDEVANTGIYNPNTSTESVLGGHEVMLCGFDVGTTPTLRPAACPPAALVMNSWGLDWGWEGSGFFWAVLPVLDASDTDLKIIHSGNKWI